MHPNVRHKGKAVVRFASLAEMILCGAFLVKTNLFNARLNGANLRGVLLVKGGVNLDHFGGAKSRPVGEGVAVFVGRLERSLRSPFRAAQA